MRWTSSGHLEQSLRATLVLAGRLLLTPGHAQEPWVDPLTRELRRTHDAKARLLEVGQVNISESSFALVREQAGSLLHFTPRGKVQAKGKGEMEM